MIQAIWILIKYLQAQIASAWSNVPCYSQYYTARNYGGQATVSSWV